MALIGEAFNKILQILNNFARGEFGLNVLQISN
jgi:hypothetical protein